MKNHILFLLLITPCFLFAQSAPIKWKDIPLDDLKMTEYTMAPEASAVVLCDYGQMYFDINPNGQHLFLFIERHVRIKILNKKGLKQASIKIPFHDIKCEKFNKENNIMISARAYNLSKKGEIQSTRLKRKNILFKDSTNCYTIAEFTIPDVKVGSVFEYKYKIPTLEMIYPKSWFFQTDIPIIYSEFRMRVPNDFQYIISPVNIRAFDINEQSNYTKNIPIAVTKYYKSKHGNVYNVKEEEWVDISGKSFRLVKKNIPAFNCNQFLDKPEDQKQRLNIHLAKIIRNTFSEYWDQLTYSLMITTDDYYDTKTPEQRRMLTYPSAYNIYTLPDWEGFSKNMLKSSRFGMPLTLYWKHKYVLDSIIKGISTDKEKMIAIYDYIRKEIKWNGVYDIYANRVFSPTIGKMYTKITRKAVNEKSLRRPFENKIGTSSEINFILIYLLNKAGIESDPVLISTRKNGRIDKNFPDAAQFNHIVAHVNLNGEPLFLDATDSLRPYNLLKKNTIGVQGFLIRKKDPGWVTLKNKQINNTKEKLNIVIDEKGKLTGNIEKEVSGYETLALKAGHKNIVENILQSEFKEYRLSNIELSGTQNEDEALNIKADFKKDTESNVVRIKSSFSCRYDAEMFDECYNRAYPVQLDYPFTKNYELNIKIPDGYVAEYPQNEHWEIYGNNAEFNYMINLQDNDLQLKIKLAIKTNEFPAHEYGKLAEFFDKVNDKLLEKITINKKD